MKKAWLMNLLQWTASIAAVILLLVFLLACIWLLIQSLGKPAYAAKLLELFLSWPVVSLVITSTVLLLFRMPLGDWINRWTHLKTAFGEIQSEQQKGMPGGDIDPRKDEKLWDAFYLDIEGRLSPTEFDVIQELIQKQPEVTSLAPVIKITKVSPLEERKPLEGRVWVTDPSQYRVFVAIKVWANWYNKPNEQAPLTEILNDGSWSCDITPIWTDLNATHVKALLIPFDQTKGVPFRVIGASSIPSHIERMAVDTVEVELIPAPQDKIDELEKIQKKR